MPNYENGKVYAIRSHQTDEVYIGSTVERLSARMSKHRADYKRYGNLDILPVLRSWNI
jgi:hypothetical protein